MQSQLDSLIANTKFHDLKDNIVTDNKQNIKKKKGTEISELFTTLKKDFIKLQLRSCIIQLDRRNCF